MKNIVIVCIMVILSWSCERNREEKAFHWPDWSSRSVKAVSFDSLKRRVTYLPVYAQIYEMNEDRRVDLAATISIRNTNAVDTVYMNKIDYYDTQGKRIRQYLNSTIYLKPMETIELIIKSSDNEGGTGANFIFESYTKKFSSAPIMEAIMISTSGQQGISFTSRGVDLGN